MEVLRHSIATTVVSCAVVIEGTSVLVEFTDGTLKQYALRTLPGRSYCVSEQGLTWKTPDEIARAVYGFNHDAAIDARNAHHDAMVQRLGWDYQQRGYR